MASHRFLKRSVPFSWRVRSHESWRGVNFELPLLHGPRAPTLANINRNTPAATIAVIKNKSGADGQEKYSGTSLPGEPTCCFTIGNLLDRIENECITKGIYKKLDTKVSEDHFSKLPRGSVRRSISFR